MKALIMRCGLHQWAVLKWGQELGMVWRAHPYISLKGSNGKAPESKLNVSPCLGTRGIVGAPRGYKAATLAMGMPWVCREKKNVSVSCGHVESRVWS